MKLAWGLRSVHTKNKHEREAFEIIRELGFVCIPTLWYSNRTLNESANPNNFCASASVVVLKRRRVAAVVVRRCGMRQNIEGWFECATSL
jgi:hypothetical protein